MGQEVTTNEILLLINERDKHTQDKLVDIMNTQKQTAETLEKVVNHIIVSEEDKKHDAEFKKETRAFIKDATPYIIYVKDVKGVTGKVKLALYVAVTFALLASAGFSLK